MANINQVSPDGGTTLYDIEDTEARTDVATLEASVGGLTSRVGIAESRILTLQGVTTDLSNNKADISSLGTSAYKNSTSVVTDSTDLVESGAVRDIVGWGNKNLLPITLDRLKALNTAGTWSGNVYTLNNVTFEIQTNDNEVTAIKLSANNASANTNLVINALANPYKIGNGSNITYTVNQFPTTFALQVDVYENGEYKSTLQSRAEDQTKTYSGNITIGVARIRVFASATISETLIYPQLEKGSTATTYEPYHASVSDSLAEKCDNSVIAPVEDGTTASQAYAVGSHFIRNGAFCTVTQAISSGGDLLQGTNYTSGDVASELEVQSSSSYSNKHANISTASLQSKKVGHLVDFYALIVVSANIDSTSSAVTLFKQDFLPVDRSYFLRFINDAKPFEQLPCTPYVSVDGSIKINGYNLTAGNYRIIGTFICH